MAASPLRWDGSSKPASLSLSPFTYVTTAGVHSYFVSTTRHTWPEAKALCEQMGGHLVTISDAAENSVAADAAAAAGDGCWIGLSCAGGAWAWLNEEAGDYRNWCADLGQPNYTNCAEPYAEMVPSNWSSCQGQWHDQQSTAVRYAILEFDQTVPQGLFGYVASRAGHDYFVSTTRHTWPEAKALCEQMGGHLVTISDAAENSVAADAAAAAGDGCWIGLSCAGGAWAWLNEETAEYRNWCSTLGQPNYSDCTEPFAEMVPSDWSSCQGQWHDQQSATVRYAILEFDPDIPQNLFTYAKTMGTCDYYVSAARYTWPEAKALCEQVGGHLVTISDAAENSVAADAAMVAGDGCWIGLSCENSTWVWLNEETAEYRNWCSSLGQPNYSDCAEPYAEMVPSDWSSCQGQWHDQQSTATRYAILEVKRTVAGVNDARRAGTLRPPVQFAGPFPNPCRRQAGFWLEADAALREARLCVYDLAGRIVQRVDLGDLPSGRHEVVWDASSTQSTRLAQGIYFVRALYAGGATATRKLLLLR